MIEGPGPVELRQRVQDLEEQNARYRRMLEQAGVSGDLRHRMRNTLSTLRLIIRQSAQTGRDLEGYAAHLEDRVAAIGRAHAAADSLGGVDLHSIIAEELLYYGVSEGHGLTLEGERIMLTPQAGLTLSLALHELAVNAVEFGSQNSPASIIVTWMVRSEDGGARLDLTWREETGDRAVTLEKRGFGSRFILDALPYQLDAKTRFDISNGAITWHIEMPLNEKTGKVLLA
jgi:two-component sensor histidine kinase